jgi:enoyl-CoA hydratase/carnithine racemase
MSETIETADVLVVESLGEVERVTLNRPARLNALNQPLTEALLTYFEGLRRKRETRVVILRGAGRAFCAGADLKAAGTSEALQDGPNGDWALRDMQKAMRAYPQPIIALVRGAAAGGGLTIALAADVVIASESAAFHPAFLAIGLSGAELGVSWRLQRAIGVSRAREMLLAGRPLRAETALAAGLVSAVTSEANLDAYGEALAADMLKARPDALRLTKRTLDAALESPSLEVAYELEERAQMLMIARRGPASDRG